MPHSRLARRLRLVSACILASALTSLPQLCAAAPTYSIDFYAISAGGNTLKGSCYRASATVAQTASGYSSASLYALVAGYWQPAPLAATDEIFFSGFQGC